MSEDATEHEPGEPTKREGQSSSREKPAERLVRGALVGRYVILDVLGEGGMGVVYAAYDPELDRKVAVKLLQATATTDQAWLQREAQAMARVTHPNVIAVFDVGTLPGDRVFVAMELVEGPTLRAWLKERKRTWREVLPHLYGAGAGLAAAHAVGLVHRDFKPDNVIVGNDGRVRVMDFGLARLRREDGVGESAARSSDSNIEVKSPLARDLTQAGYVAGTPAYLAPEIYAGSAADARSDQFAFGTALYEALFGTRPYSKDGPKTPKPPPEGSGVPARVQRVAMRAVAADPAARFPSMEALLAELAIDPGAVRRRVALAAGAVVAAAIAAFGVTTALRSHGPRCEGAGNRLAGVWDDETKHAISAAFVATKKPFAQSAYAGLERALDDYANGWTSAVTEACEATRIRGEQTEDVMVVRESCLDQRLAELSALSKILRDADASVVEKGDRVAFGLEPLAECANTAALLAPDRPIGPPARIAAYNAALAEGSVQVNLGHQLAALNAAKKAADIADELHSPALAAQPLLVRATALATAGNGDDAMPLYEQAAWAAVRAHQDQIVARSAMSSASVAAASNRLPEARIWSAFARAEVSRIGVDHDLEQHALEVEGFVAVHGNDLKTAIEDYERALAEAVGAHGRDSAALWTSEELYAATLSTAGRYADALPHFERALELHERSVGPDHPDIALILTSVGVCYAWTGQTAKARDAYARALAIREKVWGKNSPMLVITLNNQADSMKLAGDAAGALPIIERARQIAGGTLGPAHPSTHLAETTYAEILTALKRYDDARKVFDDLIATEDKVKSSILPTTQASRAELALAEHDWPNAAANAAKAVATFEASGGKMNGELWGPLVTLGEAQIELGQSAAARESLERAIAIGTATKVKDDALASARAALARIHR
ncbi:MAG TPA: serine/threonine-protein kinase [Kofleriaceae bacterium]|nr:serine/threonine-protein kinase [Kofleriaceae bacterium]